MTNIAIGPRGAPALPHRRDPESQGPPVGLKSEDVLALAGEGDAEGGVDVRHLRGGGPPVRGGAPDIHVWVVDGVKIYVYP